VTLRKLQKFNPSNQAKASDPTTPAEGFTKLPNYHYTSWTSCIIVQPTFFIYLLLKSYICKHTHWMLIDYCVSGSCVLYDEAACKVADFSCTDCVYCITVYSLRHCVVRCVSEKATEKYSIMQSCLWGERMQSFQVHAAYRSHFSSSSENKSDTCFFQFRIVSLPLNSIHVARFCWIMLASC